MSEKAENTMTAKQLHINDVEFKDSVCIPMKFRSY